MAVFKLPVRKNRLFVLLLFCAGCYFFLHKRTFSTPPPIEDPLLCPVVWKVGCTRVAVLSFASFLNSTALTACLIAQKTEYALVIPTKMYSHFVPRVSLEGIRSLLFLLQTHSWLHAVGGASLVLNENEKPACSLDKRQWTVQLREDYSLFSNGANTASVSRNETVCQNERATDITCYSCDLLSDVFLISLSVVVSHDGKRAGDSDIDVEELSSLGESARLPLFLELKGRSAYCPSVHAIMRNESKNISFDYTCNSLRMIWDGHFVQLPPLFGVYRLISPESIDHWLGCTWAKAAYDSKLPIHCSNWVRQFTLDAIDVLEKLRVDYRVIYGTLLGAARSGDVVPWTVDGDIAVFGKSRDKFRYEQWPKVQELSNWRYSNLDRNGEEHYAPDRSFPICPVRLTYSASGSSKTKSAADQVRDIGRAIRESKSMGAVFSYHENHWRSTGYVDLYDARGLPDANCTAQQIKLGHSYITLAGRKVKTVRDPVESLQCLYGRKTWDKPPPLLKDGWNSFSDALH